MKYTVKKFETGEEMKRTEVSVGTVIHKVLTVKPVYAVVDESGAVVETSGQMETYSRKATAQAQADWLNS